MQYTKLTKHTKQYTKLTKLLQYEVYILLLPSRNPPLFTEFYSHMCHDHCHFTTQGGLVQPEWLTAPIVPDSLFSFGAPVASPYYPPHCADAVFLYHPAILRQSAKILRGPRDCCSNCCFCCRSCYVAVSVLVGIMRNGFVRICVSCGCF